MKINSKMNRARAALHDPEVLGLMRKDSRFAQFFDRKGELNVDPSTPSIRKQIAEVLFGPVR